MIRVSSLKKNPKNPRQIKGEKLELLKKSVASFQKMMALRPMIVDENNIVLGGNMRLAAIKALGLKEIPDDWVKRADDLSEDEKAEFVIKDNNSFGEYDWDAIANEWDAFPLSDWGLDVPGFETVEEVGEADAEPQIDKAAELNKKWGVVSGDLWQIGSHRLLCGDSTKRDDVELLMGGEKALLMVSDPPYNVKYEYDSIDDNQDDAAYAAFCDAYFALGASISQMQIITPGKANERLYAYKEYMTWFKGFGLSRGSFYKAMVTEPILLFGEKPTNKFYNTDHFHFGTDREAGLREMHSCPKPKDLFNALIEPMSDKGDLVYEAFGGSGTTLVACQNLNRKCYAIEISESYCAVILQRMSDAFPDLEIKRLDAVASASG